MKQCMDCQEPISVNKRKGRVHWTIKLFRIEILLRNSESKLSTSTLKGNVI